MEFPSLSFNEGINTSSLDMMSTGAYRRLQWEDGEVTMTNWDKEDRGRADGRNEQLKRSCIKDKGGQAIGLCIPNRVASACQTWLAGGVLPLAPVTLCLGHEIDLRQKLKVT